MGLSLLPFLAAGLVLLVALVAAEAAQAQAGGNRAGLVVQYGDGRVETACVLFDEPELSGAALLQRSGIPNVVQTSAIGTAVCKIGGDGCDYPAEGCFCERDGARSIYWAYYTLEDDGWRYANVSAASTVVRDGTVQGWAWGLGESGRGAAPPLRELAAICKAPITVAPATAAPAPAMPGSPSPSAGPPLLASSSPLSSASPAPTTTPARVAAPGPGWASYLGFGLLVLLLLAGIVRSLRRP